MIDGNIKALQEMEQVMEDMNIGMVSYDGLVVESSGRTNSVSVYSIPLDAHWEVDLMSTYLEDDLDEELNKVDMEEYITRVELGIFGDI